MPKLTKAVIDAATPQAKPFFIWCSALAGFGIRVHPTGKLSYYVDYRAGGARRRMKLGDHGKLTLDGARKLALARLGAVAAGQDPMAERVAQRRSLTVRALCRAYLEAAEQGRVLTRQGRPKSASTVETDGYRLGAHVLPAIGDKAAARVTRADIQSLADSIPAGGQRRVVGLLGGVYAWGAKRGLVPSDMTPTRGVERRRDGARTRVLNAAELAQLGRVLRERAPVWPERCALVRLLALTGMRRGEAMALRWDEVDLEGRCLRLTATKTGRSLRPLGAAAVALLSSLPRNGEMVFVGVRRNHLDAIVKATGLEGFVLHDLRRGYATAAAMMGFPDAVVAAIVGHAATGILQRHYSHSPHDSLLAAADAVASQIAAALDS
jgi:integrase